MSIVRFRTTSSAQPAIGWLADGQVTPFEDPATIQDLLQIPADQIDAVVTDATVDDPIDAGAAMLLAPIDAQEVWAAGVTYRRSRDARMEESTQKDVYDLVYDADRPEIFLKATPRRVSGHREPVTIRSDSAWNVPEPELVLAINRFGEIVGYTVGNDMSSRAIEGENPLYLPQAKIYDGSAALGPAIVLASEVDEPLALRIALVIERDGAEVFRGETTTGQIHRRLEELVAYLFRGNTFPAGAFLMTGTGIVPPDDFSLQEGDIVHISIDGIGTLSNPVERLDVGGQ